MAREPRYPCRRTRWLDVRSSKKPPRSPPQMAAVGGFSFVIGSLVLRYVKKPPVRDRRPGSPLPLVDLLGDPRVALENQRRENRQIICLERRRLVICPILVGSLDAHGIREPF